MSPYSFIASGLWWSQALTIFLLLACPRSQCLHLPLLVLEVEFMVQELHTCTRQGQLCNLLPLFILVLHLTHLCLLFFRELFNSENIHKDSESNSKISVALAHLQKLGFADNLIHTLKTNASVSAWATQPVKLSIFTSFCQVHANSLFHAIIGGHWRLP